MNLTRRPKDVWDPFDFVRDLQDEMSRFLHTSPLRGDGDLAKWPGAFAPDIDLKEEADHFVLRTDLPGVKKDEIDISIKGGLLTLKGERKRESEARGKDYYYSERSFGTFSRTLELPMEVDAEKVKANYKDGVLELTLPKAEGARPRQIKVNIQ